MTVEFEPYPVADSGALRETVELGLGPYGGWDRIDITGIRVEARHGVYESEKVTPQPFITDLRLWVRTDRAAVSDSLDDTIDYVAISQLVAEVVITHSYDLIEKLADVVAAEVLSVAGPHQAVSVTIHKPQAAVAAGADGVAVTVHRHIGKPTP